MKNSKSVLGFINQVVGKKRILIIVITMLHALLSIADVLYAVFLRGIVDGAVDGKRNIFIDYAIGLIVLVVCHVILRAVDRYLEENAKATYENIFKKKLYETLMKKDFQRIEAVHTGQWMNHLTSDTMVVADGLVTIVPNMVGMLVKLIGVMVVIVVMQPIFGMILLVSGGILISFSYFFRQIIKCMHKKIQETDGGLRVIMQDGLENLMVVHSFAKERRITELVEEKMDEHKSARMKKNYFSNICNTGFGAVTSGAKIITAIYCANGILTNTISYGTFTVMIQLMSQIQMPLANISGFVPKYFSMIASAERLMDVEDIAEITNIGADVLNSEVIQGFYEEKLDEIGLNNVTFSYDKNKVFEKINVSINKGAYVAITGPSGCGKSTLLKLILGLYSPDSGQCYIKFADRTQIRLESKYRGLFAYVPQGNQLMSGTVRDIVTFEDQQLKNETEKIYSALEIACAKEFVKELSQGIDTLLGEKGTGLSEGQMQRLAIARAIFSGNPILILDEATSSLDEATEVKLLDNLKQMTNKTVLIVTHRKAVLDICQKEIKLGE